jgi:ABC-2 type transport system ATP-binding protein
VAYDGGTDALIQKHVDHKRIVLTFGKNVERTELEKFGKIIRYRPMKATVQVPRLETSTLAAAMLTKLPVVDVSIEEPSLEDVAQELFTNRDYA